MAAILSRHQCVNTFYIVIYSRCGCQQLRQKHTGVAKADLRVHSILNGNDPVMDVWASNAKRHIVLKIILLLIAWMQIRKDEKTHLSSSSSSSSYHHRKTEKDYIDSIIPTIHAGVQLGRLKYTNDTNIPLACVRNVARFWSETPKKKIAMSLGSILTTFCDKKGLTHNDHRQMRSNHLMMFHLKS